METKIVRALVALGVPGVALGIFYLLLKAFNFQFSQVDSTSTATIIVLFLVIVGAITFFALHRWSPPRDEHSPSLPAKVTPPPPDSYEVLKWIQEQVSSIDGDYVFTEVTHQGGQIAARLYTKAQGEVIATCFFESPDYGAGDFASTISPSVSFTRITLASVCNPDTTRQAQERLSRLACRGRLVVVPEGTEISKIGGVFCRFPDGSHLVFVALNNAANTGRNQGLLFNVNSG